MRCEDPGRQPGRDYRKPYVIPVTGVTLNKDTLSLVQGGSEVLVATVSPENATNKSVTWSSDAPQFADVDQTGRVTAVAAGSANVTVKTGDGNKTDTCAVTVAAE